MSGKVIPVGNTSQTGALLALTSASFDRIVSEIIQRMKHIDLNEDEDFILEFAMNMEFPEYSAD